MNRKFPIYTDWELTTEMVKGQEEALEEHIARLLKEAKENEKILFKD